MPDFTPRINLTKPDTGNKTWETDVENWADKVDELAAQYLTIHLGGAAIDEEVIFDGFQFDENVTLTEITLYAREAPVGSAFVVDIMKDQVELIKTTSIADGAKKGGGVITGVSFTTLQEFGLRVKTVGTTVAGSEILILVHYHIDPLV